MTTGAIIFMALSWGLVLGIAFWTYSRLLRKKTSGRYDQPESQV